MLLISYYRAHTAEFGRNGVIISLLENGKLKKRIPGNQVGGIRIGNRGREKDEKKM
jgi:hypothetical protein